MVERRQHLARDLTEPEKRIGGRSPVQLVLPPLRFSTHSLQNTGRVNSAGEPPIEPQPNGASEPLLVALEHRIDASTDLPIRCTCHDDRLAIRAICRSRQYIRACV